MESHLLGERNGEKTGKMFYIAVSDAGEINLIWHPIKSKKGPNV